jgi:hypothetical protein
MGGVRPLGGQLQRQCVELSTHLLTAHLLQHHSRIIENERRADGQLETLRRELLTRLCAVGLWQHLSRVGGVRCEDGPGERRHEELMHHLRTEDLW